MTQRTKSRMSGPVQCAAAGVWLVLVGAGCSSAPATQGSGSAAAAEQSVTGTLENWQEAVCRDDLETDTGTRHVVNGSACVPHDGDGIVNFDHFESTSSMDSVLSWSPTAHIAQTVVDGRPLAIWTSSDDIADLDPLKGFGFNVASYQSPSLARLTDELPAVVPSGDAVSIPPNEYGYVVVQTAGGDTQCIVETTFIGCQTDGTKWQQHRDGSGPYHGVRINTDGTGSWVDGNLGAAAPTTLANQTYRAQGWTIVSSPSGMRFTNDTTRHGAVVSIEGVQPF